MAAAGGSAAAAASAPLLRFIDVGINLTDPVFKGSYHGKQLHPDDFAAVLDRARAQGVAQMVITGGNLEESRHAVAMAKQHKLFCTVGCHPTRCNEFLTKAKTPEAYLAELDKLIGDNLDVVRAVGECGLDYDRTHFCPADVQRRFFPLHFRLAAKYKLPLFLHNRNTGEDFTAIMQEHADVVAECGGVVHSFTGSVGEMRALTRLNLHLSVNGCSMKTDENLRALQEMPLDRLMLETDAPWCDIRPTHASFPLLWPRGPATGQPSSSSLQQQPKKGVAAKAPSTPPPSDPKSKRLEAYAAALLPAMPETVKPEKYRPGCMVKGRNEPATIVSVFEVLFALREAEIEGGPRELADKIFATTCKFFKIAPDCRF